MLSKKIIFWVSFLTFLAIVIFWYLITMESYRKISIGGENKSKPPSVGYLGETHSGSNTTDPLWLRDHVDKDSELLWLKDHPHSDDPLWLNSLRK